MNIVFFNNKGGVGKTTLVYHLAWTFAALGVRTLAVDLDPQSDLTSMFLSGTGLWEIWNNDNSPATISGCLKPLMDGKGSVAVPDIKLIGDHLYLLSGNLNLSIYEDKLAEHWNKCSDHDALAFRITESINDVIELAVQQSNAELILIDVGSNFGAINRSVLIAADYIISPLSIDLQWLKSIKNLKQKLKEWEDGWAERLEGRPASLPPVIQAKMESLGYVIIQHDIRDLIPIKVLARMRHYSSLLPMARAARKPMFRLTSADGAIGAHQSAVKMCGEEFSALAIKIASLVGLKIEEK